MADDKSSPAGHGKRLRLPRIFAEKESVAPSLPPSVPPTAPAVGVGAHSPSPAAVAVTTNIQRINSKVDEALSLLHDLNDRELTQAKVFDTLHAELASYKNDFFYEHLKPVLRPLLFLFDSLEQFEAELETDGSGALRSDLVRQNLDFFKDQLVEVLRMCEVEQMTTPEGTSDLKQHKVVEARPVESGTDNQIVAVKRQGWLLRGQVLRPAEVVVTKLTK